LRVTRTIAARESAGCDDKNSVTSRALVRFTTPYAWVLAVRARS
jgi:hypothetical protein